MAVIEKVPEFRKIIPWRLAIIFLIFSTAIILIGIFYYDLQKKMIIDDQENNLTAIALLKIRQIENWRKERLGGAKVISLDRPLIASIKQFFSGKDKEVKAEVTDWMKSVGNEYDYSNVLIADTSFKIRLSLTPSDSILGDSIKREIKSAFSEHKISMIDLHRSTEIPYIHIDILIPLFDSVKNKLMPVGITILRIDPKKVLFPLIQSWPTLSKSSETLLFRKERDSILYLNELRHSRNTALKLKLALTNKMLLAAKAVNGFEGVAEGTDYRNIPVVGSLHKIPNSSWFMVAKVDKAELLSPLKKYLILIALVIILLILINASIFGFWIWRQRIKFYRNQLKNEVSFREMEERFTTAFKMSPVSVTISSVADNKFIDINNTFLNDMGYKREEVIGRTAKELNIWADESERLWIINEISEKGRIFGKVIGYKNMQGEKLYGLTSIAVVKVNGEPCNLSTVVNITENKNAEEHLKVSEELFRKLFENMLNGFAYCKMIYEDGQPADFLYLNVNEAFGFLTGLNNVVGKRASEAIPGIREADPGLIERYGRVASTGSPEVFEIYVESLEMWFAISVYSPQKEYFVAVFDVITNRKLAEEKLLENEKRLREAQEMAHLGFWLWDIKTGNVDWSEEVYKIFSLDPETFIPKIDSILELSPWPEDHQRDKELIARAMEDHSPGEYEQKFLRPDKSIGYYLSTFRGSYDVNGDLISIVGTILDITSRKMSEMALRESEDRFKYIFEHSALGNSISLPSGEVHFNDAFCKILGYTAEELTNMRWQDFTHPDDFEITQNVVDSLMSHKSDSPRFVKRYIRKDGSIVWADILTSLRRDNTDKPLYFMTTVNDITENRRIEDELRLQAEILSHMIEAVYLVRMEDGIIVYTNSRFEELFGYLPGEMIGKHFSIVNAPADKSSEDTASKIISELIAEEAWTGEVYNIKKNGTAFWTKANVTIFDHSAFGKVLVSVQEDITDRKNAESQIKKLNEELEGRVILRTEQLETANKELEAFSYSVSHDLRAPLRSVHGFTKILLEDYESILDDEGKRICGIISSSASQMGALIDDLLSFSRIGRSNLSPSEIDMKKTAKMIFEGMTSLAERKRIKLNIGTIPIAFGDVSLIGQVWTNLISNAIKYTSKNVIAEIEIGSKAEVGMITYFIKDNGVGFEMKYAHKLFGVFQRLHSEAEFEGNGVGLAIIQRIISKHSGKVWAEGEVGMGATFYFSLPVIDTWS